MTSTNIRIFGLVLLGLAACLGLMAQTTVTGGLVGTVTDPSGAVVASGKVAVQNDATGETQTASIGSVGEFQFSLLRPGVYTATVTVQGFEKTSQRVTVGLGQIANLKLRLEIARQAETVSVAEEATMIQTDDGNMATTFDPSQLENLPAPGNDMTSYALTAPGVTVSTGGGTATSRYSDCLGFRTSSQLTAPTTWTRT